MPGYFQSQSPWLQAAGLAGEGKSSLAHTVLAMAQMKRQAALQQQEAMMQAARMQQQQGQFDADLAFRKQEFDAKQPLQKAETEHYQAQTKELGQKMSAQDERSQMAANIRALMGAMKSPLVGQLMRDPQSAAAIMGALRSADVAPQGGFEMTGDQLIPTIQAALPVLLSSEAVQTPGGAQQLLVQTPQRPGYAYRDKLTGKVGEQVPYAPQLKTYGRGGYGVFDPNNQTFDVLQQSQPYPSPVNSSLSVNTAANLLGDNTGKLEQFAALYPQGMALLTNTLNQAAQRFQPPVPQSSTNANGTQPRVRRYNPQTDSFE